MNRPLFVKYCGRQINPDTVVWYDRSIDKVMSEYYNTGDICVYESTLRLIDFDSHRYLNIDEPVDFELAKKLRESCDVLVLRGSNYIHENMNWGYFADWLDALQMPIVCAGVGAQAETKRKIALPPDGLRTWKTISNHCHSIGVRGNFSAQTLLENGIQNIQVVGCPTMFRDRNPNVKVRFKSSGVQRVTFSLRREVDHTYSRDPEEFRKLQKQLLFKMNKTSDLWLSSHGEPEEKAFFYKSPLNIQNAKDRLVADGWFDEATGDQLISLYERKLYYSAGPSDYDVYVKQFDAAIGYRVHAILPAAALGIPAVLVSYDTRSDELAESFDLPLFKAEHLLKMPASDIFDASRFSNFEKNFNDRYRAMKKYLEDNGVSTRM